MPLEKCPQRPTIRCPHKEDACKASESEECHYLGTQNTIGSISNGVGNMVQRMGAMPADEDSDRCPVCRDYGYRMDYVMLRARDIERALRERLDEGEDTEALVDLLDDLRRQLSRLHEYAIWCHRHHHH